MFKVIIAGGRDFEDYLKLKLHCDKILSNITDDIEVVCGGARGADFLGKQYAIERGYSVKLFKADWDRFGKSAGMIRNKEMAEYSDAAICFWDGKSRGTSNMIELSKKYGLKLRIVKY